MIFNASELLTQTMMMLTLERMIVNCFRKMVDNRLFREGGFAQNAAVMRLHEALTPFDPGGNVRYKKRFELCVFMG